LTTRRNRHAHYVAHIEQMLRDAGCPYVAVDDAKKAIFAGAKIASFDFLIYMPRGDHLLVTVLPKSRPMPTASQRDALRQWQRVFGAGFVGAFVHATDNPTAWMLDENPVGPKPLRSVLMADVSPAALATPAAPAAPVTEKEPSHANVEVRMLWSESPGQL